MTEKEKGATVSATKTKKATAVKVERSPEAVEVVAPEPPVNIQPSSANGTQQVEINLKELKERKISDLNKLAREFGIEGSSSMRKQDLIFALLQAQSERGGVIYGEGVLETLSLIHI